MSSTSPSASSRAGASTGPAIPSWRSWTSWRATKGLQAAPAGLIGDLVRGQTELVRLAKAPTAVDLRMRLTGDLQRPNVDFAIDLPDLQGQLRNYLNSQLALIRADPNELNRQVFGLVVIRQFLPRFNDLQASTVGFNTISELFASQFSYLLTELLTSLTGDNSALSGIDLSTSGSRPAPRWRGPATTSRRACGPTSSRTASRSASGWPSDRTALRTRAPSRPATSKSSTPSPTTAASACGPTRAATSTSATTTSRARASRVTYRREFDTFGELFGAVREPREVERVFVPENSF